MPFSITNQYCWNVLLVVTFLTGILFCVIFFLENQASCNVEDFGAIGDGRMKDTDSIQLAIDSCQIVEFPSNRVFLTGALRLKSNLVLRLLKNSRLLASTEEKDFPLVTSRCEGVPCVAHSSLLYGENVHNVTIEGDGVIDGNGKTWWRKFFEMELSTERPKLLSVFYCSRLRVEGVTFLNSPYWTIHPAFCTDVTFNRLTIKNPELSPNTDGINPDSSRNVLISRVNFDTGDDCIAIKSGKRVDGEEFIAVASENITIFDCNMFSGHGAIAIGSEMSGNVTNVRINDCIITTTEAGLRMKTVQGRGGFVRGISFTNIRMLTVPQPLDIEMGYHGTLEQVGDNLSPSPSFGEIKLSRVTMYDTDLPVVNNGYNLNINCLPSNPCTNVVFNDFIIYQGVSRVFMNQVWGDVHGAPFYFVNNLTSVQRPYNPGDHLLSVRELRGMVTTTKDAPKHVLSMRNLMAEKAASTAREDESWREIEYVKNWRKVPIVPPVPKNLESASAKQKDLWMKWRANRNRYEANWAKYDALVESGFYGGFTTESEGWLGSTSWVRPSKFGVGLCGALFIFVAILFVLISDHLKVPSVHKRRV